MYVTNEPSSSLSEFFFFVNFSYICSRFLHEQKIGTASEDAYRRDLTINALFYNINEARVEDFTGRGVEDLRAGIIRTPLPPLETFLDDPLRVLRSIRFAARLGFRCEQELLNAAAAPVVREALHSKISRERIGKELSLMMTGPRFDVAVALLQQVELWNAVFKLPESLCAPSEDVTAEHADSIMSVACGDAAGPSWDGNRSVQIVGLMLSHEKLPEPTDADSEIARKCVLLSSLLFPLYGREYLIAKKKRREPVSNFIILDSLKLSTRETQGALLIQAVAEEFTDVIRKVLACGNVASVFQRGSFGMLLRKAGPMWQYSLALAACTLIAEGGIPSDICSAKAAVIGLYETYNLGNAWEQRPLITVCFIIHCYRVFLSVCMLSCVLSV